MFGNNVTSSWGTPQQNQQQPQQTSAFGQPTGFGTGAFGSTGAFGQTPQQQPQANPMFGNLGGTPSTTTANAGFGAFGGAGNTSQSGTTNSMFGAKPATGFGAFGGGTFGSGGGFGQSTPAAGSSGTSTSVFGQPAGTSTTGAFGAPATNVFAKATSPFGASQTNTQGTAAVVTAGSSNPPYSVFTEKDSAANSNVTLQYQAISCMPAYAGTSHEELRLQDYLQGRKTSSTTFGAPAAFGGTSQTNTSIFGAQPAQQTNQPSAFGAPATNTGFGAFGAPATTQSVAAPASTGAFGGGAFGQPQQQQSSGFGGFGSQPQPQPQSQQGGGLFGGNAFGATKPATGFGTFGNTTTGGGTFGGSAFGQTQQQQPQQPQQPANSLFGNTQQPATTGFGGFGANTTKPSIFGSTPQATSQPATTGFGTFGATQQQQNQQPQTQPSLFGGTGGGIFGSTQPQQQQQSNQPAGNPLFGGNTQPGLFGGSLFNNNNSNNQQQQQQPAQAGGFNLFGNKPAAPANQSLFGGGFGQQQQQPANNAPQQGLFGSSLGQGTNQQSTLGGGLFGAKTTAPMLGTSTSTGQGGLFGSTNTSTGLFNSTNNPTQGTLTASLSQPVGSLFDMLPGPRSINLDNSQPKKKSGFFVDIPTRSPVPRVQLGYTPANSKLRGFSSTSMTTGAGNPFASLSFTSGKPNALSLSRVSDNKPALGTDAFLGRSASPSLGSGARQSVKKVILDKKIEPSELFTKSGGSPGLRGSKVVFSPALSITTREKDALAALSPTVNGTRESPTPAPRPLRTPNRFTAQSTQNALHSDDTLDQSGSSTLEEGDYWVKPDLATLKQTGYDQLSSFNDLIVGRVGYGEIHFLEPVDLTGLPKLGALLGEVVRFDDKECSVYPDSEEVDKPPPGSGLNVRAKLTLLHCWAVDKATREPIKDASHAASVKHLKRLKNMKDTHFESFDITDGKWTFTVDHF
ncbi:nucleoporin autopeptidase-domain-containing protein [Collybia nuda]|uniref:Nucleoporin autopeptidase-domain-containing protein n=1 Tax=Collybia nuda TaxID=64659 RepID=A0A9P5Y7L6_9AGAR|nr:nucleoporin autopeptidase-domain-containing protein [Collybia nuda]